jgi:hypothetical protein
MNLPWRCGSSKMRKKPEPVCRRGRAGDRWCLAGELGLTVHNPSVAPCPPPGASDCEPDLQVATPTVYYLRNKKKQRNFIMADITAMGYFHFYVENVPNDGTGCPGGWLFQAAWDHFVQTEKVIIKGVRGDWTSGENLDTVNRLTAGNRMTLEEASKQTWTYQQASTKGFTRYQYLDAKGSPGNYTSVDVVFLP